MNKIFPLLVLITGLVLLYFGLEAGDSIGSSVSEVVNDAPSNKSIVLTVVGVLAAVSGGIGLMRSSGKSGS
jgi:capsule polysaccharide export protein KpsE/RkpR